MNFLIAKSGRQYHKVLSQNNTILETFNYLDVIAVPFSASYKLDEEEWFKIDEFSTKSFFIDECKNDFSTTSLNQISNTEFDKIKTLCVIQGDIKFFQKITPALFVRRKKFIDASGTPKIVENRKQLEITKESDAIYISSTDTLYFNNLSKIKSIFPGIEVLHRVATQGEVDSFLGNGFIDSNALNSNKVGSANRKRIADIGIKYNKLPQPKKDLLIQYAKDKAGIELNDDGNFIVDSEDKLKNLLYAMDERYYRSDIYEEDRLANSIKVVPNI